MDYEPPIPAYVPDQDDLTPCWLLTVQWWLPGGKPRIENLVTQGHSPIDRYLNFKDFPEQTTRLLWFAPISKHDYERLKDRV